MEFFGILFQKSNQFEIEFISLVVQHYLLVTFLLFEEQEEPALSKGLPMSFTSSAFSTEKSVQQSKMGHDAEQQNVQESMGHDGHLTSTGQQGVQESKLIYHECIYCKVQFKCEDPHYYNNDCMVLFCSCERRIRFSPLVINPMTTYFCGSWCRKKYSQLDAASEPFLDSDDDE